MKFLPFARRHSRVALVASVWSAISCSQGHQLLSGGGDSACIGEMVTPGDDLTALARTSAEGATFCLKSGTYRGVSVIPKKGQHFVGEPGVRFVGARLLTHFDRDGALYMVTGQPQRGQIHGGCDASHPRCMYPEDLYVDDRPLLHVATKSGVVSGGWFFDYDAHAIYFADDPTGHMVELGDARNAFAVAQGGTQDRSPVVPGVVIEGISIEKYAIPAQMGAIGDQYPSPGWTIRNCEVKLNHGVGITLAADSTAHANFIHDNGYGGLAASDANVVVSASEIGHNHTLGFDLGFGLHFANTRNLVVRGDHVFDNASAGIWTESENAAALYDGNNIENNDGPGIWHQYSFDAVIRNNRLRNNGLRGDYVYSAEILVHNSPGVQVYGNQLEVGATSGAEGMVPNTRHSVILFQETPLQVSTTGRAYDTADSDVHDNRITFLSRQSLLAKGAGATGVGEFSTGDSVGLRSNRFDANRYVAPDCSEGRFYQVLENDAGVGVGVGVGFAAFQAAGQELHGACSGE